MLQMVSTQLGGSQKALIELNKKGHNAGRLRFARYDDFRTFTYNQSGFEITRHGNTDLLYLSKT